MAGRAKRMEFPHLAELVEYGGEVRIGESHSLGCVASATQERRPLALLVRNPGEPFLELLTRLEEAVGRAIEEEIVVDEVNG